MAISMPYVLCSKVNLFLIISAIIGSVLISDSALAASCQVYPSEYAYHQDSVKSDENASANCRNYPPGNLQGGDHPEHYIHCNGKELELADSIIKKVYHTNDYYVWNASRDGKLLFIFQTTVSLTTITLHYHSDNFRGLPRLELYAVPDDFDVWDAPNTSYFRVNVTAVPPSGVATAGPRNVSINVNFNTRRVLMYQFNSSLIGYFAVSEVEFFTCNSSIQAEFDSHHVAPTLPQNPENFDKTSSLVKTMSITPSSITDKKVTAVQPNNVTGVVTIGASIAVLLMLSATTLPENLENFDKTSSLAKTMSITPSSITDKKVTAVQSNNVTRVVTIGASIAILLMLSVILIGVVLIWSYKRRSIKRKLYTDSPYSTLSKETGQQIQLKSTRQDSAQLDNQVHLSPFTGQTEFIPKPESASINSPNPTSQNSHPTHSTAGDEYPLALNVAYQGTTYESTSEQPTYEAVDKIRKTKFKKQTKKEDPNCKVADKGPPISAYKHEVSSTLMQVTEEKAEEQVINPPHTVEELYTAVKKKPKGSDPKDEEEEITPMSLYTVEELYTAIEKKPKSNADENKEASSQTFLQNTAEDLYTAVTKKLKGGLTDGTEVAPPIPPYTVEELYTAVMKKPKESAEGKEEAPPIPPYIVDEN